MDKITDCFKCSQKLSGTILALGTYYGDKEQFWRPDFPAHLKCLSDNIQIFGGEVLVSKKGRNSWSHHYVEKNGRLYHTYIRTVLDDSWGKEKNGSFLKKARYCIDCKVDCCLTKDPFFYCGSVGHKRELLWLKCNKCFVKIVGDWKCQGITSSDSFINTNVPMVHLYSSPEVYYGSF